MRLHKYVLCHASPYVSLSAVCMRVCVEEEEGILASAWINNFLTTIQMSRQGVRRRGRGRLAFFCAPFKHPSRSSGVEEVESGQCERKEGHLEVLRRVKHSEEVCVLLCRGRKDHGLWPFAPWSSFGNDGQGPCSRPSIRHNSTYATRVH
jgi:hypothetical protein